MANEIRKTSSAPYVENSDAELDSVQYGVLFHTVRNSSLMSDIHKAIGVNPLNNEGDIRLGPQIVDDTATDALATTIFNNIADPTTYADVAAVKMKLVGGTATKTQYNHAPPGLPEVWKDEEPTICAIIASFPVPPPGGLPPACTPVTRTATVLPMELAEPVVISGVDISGIAGPGELETTTTNTTVSIDVNSPAFADLITLVTDPTVLNGQSVDIKVTHAVAEVNTSAPLNLHVDLPDEVIPAINELKDDTDLAVGTAQTNQEQLWNTAVGQWNASQVLDTDAEFLTRSAAIEQINTDWNTLAGRDALLRLNLIPVLENDKIQVNVEYTDPDTGETETVLDVDPNSQVNLLEAVWTLWRHVKTDTTNTYGVSALTDPSLSADQLIPPLSSMSHIDIFNMLHESVVALSGDITTINNAISGTGDVLISELSGNSIYNNLNTIYTGLTAVEDCCDTNTINISALSAAIDNLPDPTTGDSTITTIISGVSGDVFIPDLSGNSIIKNINNIYTGLTANTECCDTNTTAITSLQECCDTNTTSITSLSTLVTNLTGTGGGADVTNIQYAISGDGSDVLITNLSGDNIFENLNILYYELSGFSDCCDLIKTHLSGGDDTTITNQLSTLIETNAININVLSGCCDNNSDAINILKNIIYGPSQTDVFHTDLTNGSIITNINTLYTTLTGLIGAPLTGSPEPGTPDPWANILNNTTNINNLFTDITNLSATITQCCENQTTTLSAFSGDLVTMVNNVQNEVTNIDNTVTNNITNITNSLSSYVDLTTNQIISGSKTFDDPTLVDAPLSAGEDVTIGTGDTIFNVCTDENGETQVTINGLREDGVHDISALPINSVYIKDINGVKVLAIKTS